MNRGTGSGLIGLGVVLAVAGAIMRYAITSDTSSLDLSTAGGILLLVGIVAAIIGLILVVMSGRRSTTQREQIVATPTGTERVTEQEGWAG
jgi:beta-lactamase regulating signal transducer with metallopeptidase domain